MKGETVDELGGYGLRVIQRSEGYRFSIDPVLLADFARGSSAARIIDLGAGSGVVSLLLARLTGATELIGVELQEDLAVLARRNAELNGLSDRIRIVAADVMSLRTLYPVSSFDLVVANPPYRRRGTGKVSPKAGRDLARHESTAALADFLAIAKYLVAPGGRICFIHHPERLAEFLSVARDLKLSPLRLRMVHGSLMHDARMFLVELAKGRRGSLRIMPPLAVYSEDGSYRDEVAAMLAGESVRTIDLGDTLKDWTVWHDDNN